MAANNISLSVDSLSDGRFKIRWREDVIEDGVPVRKARSQVVSDKGARDALVAKLRRTLETGEVYTPEARTIVTSANLEVAALAWLRWQVSQEKAPGTVKQYKCAVARIMETIRTVEQIPADAVIPASCLTIDLTVRLRARWILEDETGIRKCCPKQRYQLSAHLHTIWNFAGSQPDTFKGVPPVPAKFLCTPPYPGLQGAPDDPTWAEMDAVVRRAYATEGLEWGDLLAGERCTGLRVDQVASIRRRAVDVTRGAITVETGKSKGEKLEARTIPVPRHLLALWAARIAKCTGPDDYLFSCEARADGKIAGANHGTVRDLWKACEDAGEVRQGLSKPTRGGRRKARTNHAFRSGFMAGLEAHTVEIDGAEVQRVSDKTIDFLVGHAPATTRGKHYVAPKWRALEAAVALVPPVALEGAGALGSNVVRLHG